VRHRNRRHPRPAGPPQGRRPQHVQEVHDQVQFLDPLPDPAGRPPERRGPEDRVRQGSGGGSSHPASVRHLHRRLERLDLGPDSFSEIVWDGPVSAPTNPHPGDLVPGLSQERRERECLGHMSTPFALDHETHSE
jgi:hypothetical protein